MNERRVPPCGSSAQQQWQAAALNSSSAQISRGFKHLGDGTARELQIERQGECKQPPKEPMYNEMSEKASVTDVPPEIPSVVAVALRVAPEPVLTCTEAWK